MDSRRRIKRENSIKPGFLSAFEMSKRDLNRTIRAILTRSTGNIFRARDRREDFSRFQLKSIGAEAIQRRCLNVACFDLERRIPIALSTAAS
jgi:hypothetical protein